MKKLLILIYVVVALFTTGCQKAINSNGQQSIDNYTGKCEVTGQVVDVQGHPIPGVRIEANNYHYFTDSNGIFILSQVQWNGQSPTVKAYKEGYFEAIKRCAIGNMDAISLHFILLPQENPQYFQSDIGGTIQLPEGGKVQFEPNSIMFANGSAFTGQVTVYSTWINPEDPQLSDLIPGSFMGQRMNLEEQLLTSFGMIGVELYSNDHQKLQIKSGKQATLTFPLPIGMQGLAPDEIPLWSIDQETGLWKEEGKALKVNNQYVGNVSHFSFWNCDVPENSINLSGNLVDDSNIPLVNVKIGITSLNDGTTRYVYTNYSGSFFVTVPKGKSLKIEVVNSCGQNFWLANVNAVTHKNLGNITSPSLGSTNLIKLIGKITSCDQSPSKNGYVAVKDNNVNGPIQLIKASSNGSFGASLIFCNPTVSATIEVQDVYNATFQIYQKTLQLGTNNLGSLNACGQIFDEYYNWSSELNGVVSYFGVVRKQNAYLDAGFSPVNNLLGIAVGDDDQKIFSGFSFNGMTLNEPHYLMDYSDHLATLFWQNDSIESLTILKPTPVHLNSIGSQGEGVIEGSFDTEVKGDITPQRKISCHFRVKRND